MRLISARMKNYNCNISFAELTSYVVHPWEDIPTEWEIYSAPGVYRPRWIGGFRARLVTGKIYIAIYDGPEKYSCNWNPSESVRIDL